VEWKKALDLDPDYSAAHSNMLLCMNYESRFDQAEVYAAHRQWAEQHLLGVNRYSEYCNPPEPDRRIRVAYVSPDFREHSVAYFIKPVIRNHVAAACGVQQIV